MRHVTIGILIGALGTSPHLGSRVPVQETCVPALERPLVTPRLPGPLDHRAKPSRIEDTYHPGMRAVLLAPSKHTPTLSVTPLVGLAPLEVSITLRLAVPQATDRQIELTAWDAGDEDAQAIYRSTRDVLWPDEARPFAQTMRASWALPAGSMLIVGCVLPRATCVAQRVVVS